MEQIVVQNPGAIIATLGGLVGLLLAMTAFIIRQAWPKVFGGEFARVKDCIEAHQKLSEMLERGDKTFKKHEAIMRAMAVAQYALCVKMGLGEDCEEIKALVKEC